jgi:RNA polymerase sigma-70 factor (ECF subfamily)
MPEAQDDSAEDAALARRIGATRDTEAEASLCRRLFPRLRAYGLRHLRDEAAAADLAQHVLVVTIEALRESRVTEPERLAAFLMGTCRNTILDWRKTDRRRASLLERFGPSFAEAATTEPAALDREKLAHCLEHLTARERAIVTLTYFVEREADEIGRELAMSPGNVRVARHRALAHLHDCLTQGGDAP